EALTYSFPPSRLATLVAPFWLGGSVERPHYWVLLVEASCYLGMLPLALALVGLARPTRCSLFLLGFGLVAFALAMGEDSPLYLLVLSIPVIGWVRAPARFLALGVLSAALLAGQGLDALQAARARRWAGLVAAGLVFVALGVALAAWRGERTVLFLPKRRDPLGLGQWDTLVLLLTLAGAAALLALLARRGPRSRTLAVLCLAFAAGDLFGMKSRLPFNALADPPFDARSASASGIRRDGGEGRFYTFIEKEPWRGHERRRYLDGYRRLMWDSLRNSLPMRKGLQSLTGLQNEPPVHARLVQAVSGRGRMDRRAARLLGAYGIRYVISATPATAPELVLVSRDLLSVYRNELATPRAHLVPERRIAADAEGAFALVKRPDFDAFRTVVLESASGEEPRLPAGAAAVGVGRASILRDEPDRVVIGTSSGRPGWLVLNDTFAPGWRAEVDGRTRPILRANGLVRAVEVGAGRHRVEFVYAPDSVRRGAALSLVGLLATSVLLLGRTSRPPRPEPGALDAA
ncbi:MAG TPA: hypothetical protein VIC87_08885, partial [Vicinamibacteria bacterium]